LSLSVASSRKRTNRWRLLNMTSLHSRAQESDILVGRRRTAQESSGFFFTLRAAAPAD
jgi:hypothetical protein